MFTLELPHQGDSNEYTQYTIFQYEEEKHPKLSQICSYGNFSKGLKNEFDRAVVNEPSVFKPLKFYCILYISANILLILLSSSFTQPVLKYRELRDAKIGRSVIIRAA